MISKSQMLYLQSLRDYFFVNFLSECSAKMVSVYERPITILLMLCFTCLGHSQKNQTNAFINQQFKKTNPLFGYRVGPNTLKMNLSILKPFSTDGCSLSPNKIGQSELVDCCVAHDMDYWIGGTRAQKEMADANFYQCLLNKTDKLTANGYLKGVTLGGSAKYYTTFRWGYGWNHLRDYGPLTMEEVRQSEDLYGADLMELKEMIHNKRYKINLELMTMDFVAVNRTLEDAIVYYFLQNRLVKPDTVSYGAKIVKSNFLTEYRLRLESCDQKIISIYLDRAKILADHSGLTLNIHTMRWDDLKKYIVTVNDHQNCLN